MARPKTIDDAVILKAARELFLQKGATLTTAEVAKRAGVAQGTIFKRYKTKQALFRAAMHSEAMPWMSSVEKHAEKDLKKALVELGHAIVTFGRKALPLLMMSWSNRGEFGLGHARAANDEIPFRPVEDLRRFFDTQVRAKRLRAANPRMMAAAFFGGMMNYTFVELMLGEHPIEDREFIRGFVELLWEGIRP